MSTELFKIQKKAKALTQRAQKKAEGHGDVTPMREPACGVRHGQSQFEIRDFK
jgi:hypothetical protein